MKKIILSSKFSQKIKIESTDVSISKSNKNSYGLDQLRLDNEKVDNSVKITHKGVKYGEQDLNNISYNLSENYVPKNNYQEDDKFKVEDNLSTDHKAELKNWFTKMQASSWKSRQRSLRKKGKLEQYKIDSLNKLGMLWDPRESIWEKMYVIYKKNGLCDEIEDWVKEQRSLYNNNKLSKENLVRLELIKFPFNTVAGEQFPFTFNSLHILQEKLRKKKRRLELKLFNNPPKKLNDKQKEIIYKEQQSRSLKKTRQKERKKKSKWSVLRSRYVSTVNSFKISNFSIDEVKEIIEKIEKGESMYYLVISDFINNFIAKKKFTKYSLLNANKPGHFFGNSSFETAFLEEHKIFSNSPIDEVTKYNQICEFTNSNDYSIQSYACNIAINYFGVFANSRTRNFEPVDQIIKLYKNKGEINKLTNLKDKIQKFPLLSELYNDKIDKLIIKLSKK